MFDKYVATPASILIGALLLAGCTNQPVTSSEKAHPTTRAGAKVNVYICRPNSFVKSLESPDLFIDGVNMAEITNGSQLTVSSFEGAELRVKLVKNILVQRFNDQLIYQTTISDQPVYLIIAAGSPDWASGLAVLFGGNAIDIAASADKSVGRWWKYLRLETKQQFDTACSQI